MCMKKVTYFLFFPYIQCVFARRGPQIWDEAHATDIIDGEKPQSNGVQVEFGE